MVLDSINIANKRTSLTLVKCHILFRQVMVLHCIPLVRKTIILYAEGRKNGFNDERVVAMAPNSIEMELFTIGTTLEQY